MGCGGFIVYGLLSSALWQLATDGGQRPEWLVIVWAWGFLAGAISVHGKSEGK